MHCKFYILQLYRQYSFFIYHVRQLYSFLLRFGLCIYQQQWMVVWVIYGEPISPRVRKSLMLFIANTNLLPRIIFRWHLLCSFLNSIVSENKGKSRIHVKTPCSTGPQSTFLSCRFCSGNGPLCKVRKPRKLFVRYVCQVKDLYVDNDTNIYS